jgi:hypothetical protein
MQNSINSINFYTIFKNDSDEPQIEKNDLPPKIIFQIKKNQYNCNGNKNYHSNANSPSKSIHVIPEDREFYKELSSDKRAMKKMCDILKEKNEFIGRLKKDKKEMELKVLYIHIYI